MTNTSAIVQNLWNCWNVIHDDGMGGLLLFEKVNVLE